MPEPEIRINLIGPPQILRDGQPVKIPRRLHRAILYYIAEKQQPVTRGHLCGLFWPEVPEDAARKNLREALSCLRRALGSEDTLLTNENQVSLNPVRVTCDLPEFVKAMDPLLSSAEMKSPGPLPEALAQHFRHYLTIGRTNQVIQGVNLPHLPEFENWKELTRQSYNYTRAKVLDRLIDHYISSGDLEEAMIWLEKALQLNPLDVNLNFLILSELRDLGRFEELSNYVDYLENLFRQNEEPLPEKFTELQKQARIAQKKPDTKVFSLWEENVPGEVKFFDRKAQLEELRKAYYRKGIVHLIGGRGTGKTRLLKEFFSQLPYQPRLVYIQGVPFAAKVPFRAVIDGITKTIRDEEWLLLDQADRELMDSFVYTYLQDWEKLKKLEDENRSLPLLENVFAATYRLLEKFTLGRPILMILDDASWLDMASVILIGYLTERHFFKKNGLLVFVTREEIDNPSLARLLAQLVRKNRIVTIPLENFKPEETSLFIQHISGSECHPLYAQQILLNTGGNPYYMLECLQEIKRTQMDISHTPGLRECPIPRSVETLVRELLKRLDTTGIHMLSAAAILGNKFAPDLLELMLGYDAEKFQEGMDKLKGIGILNVDPGIQPSGGYCFRQDIERKIVLKGLDPAYRRRLHLKAAAVLTKRRGRKSAYSGEIAGHYEEAGEPERALDFWQIAAGIARTAGIYDHAHIAYEGAMRQVSANPYLFPSETIQKLVLDYSSFLLDQDDHPGCEKVYQDCLKLGTMRGDTSMVQTAQNGLEQIRNSGITP
jgi:DNA-binding SARP family transcriptional activator